MPSAIFCLVSAVVLAVCGICTLYTGILRRKNRKANSIFSLVLILCIIAFVISPYIRPSGITNFLPDDYGFKMFAFSYAVMTLLYLVIYSLSLKKNTDKMQHLVFSFSVFIALITLLSAIILFCTGILCVSVGLGLIIKI